MTTQSFNGYRIPSANFVQLPLEILRKDAELGPELHHTMLCAAGEILWQQFRQGLSRDTLIPIPLRWWVDNLGVGPNAVRTRLARLEALGRLIIKPNPDPKGGNLFGIRWAEDDERTVLMSHRIQVRVSEIRRLRRRARALVPGGPLQSTEGVPPPPSTEGVPPSVDGRGTPSVDGTPSIKKVENTDTNTPHPSVSQYPSVSADASAPRTDRRMVDLLRKPGEQLDPGVLDALSRLLDPPQVPRVKAGSPLNSKGLWALMEAVRLHGAKLARPVAVIYNAAMNATKAEAWVLRVLRPLERGGWYVKPEDDTASASPERRQVLSRLQGLQLIPLDQEGQERHLAILRAEARTQAAALLGEDCEEDELDEPPVARPRPVSAAEFGLEQAQRIRTLIQTWRDISRRLRQAHARGREGLFNASREAWKGLVAELETAGPLLRAQPGTEAFSPSALAVKHVNDLAKVLGC